MVYDLSIVIKAQEEGDKNLLLKRLNAELRKKYSGSERAEFVFAKKSVDARHGQLKLCLRYKAYVGEETPKAQKEFSWRKSDGSKKVVIVGSGPAGLFAALKLLERGVKPIIIERGKPAPERKRDIAAISTKGVVDADSNYCFGEGGAGTFSDGKLYTRSNKRGDIGGVLQTFAHFGADPKILTDAHPHIGTNKLPQIIQNMRAKIIELGGEFHFENRVVDFVMEGGNAKNGGKTSSEGGGSDSGLATIRGVVARTADGGQKTFLADAVILATGHSATDIYELLAKAAPESLQAKTFAVGVRVEHPRELIDKIQYHGKRAESGLGAAEYRLTAQVDGRGVYSFCMCPGGFVVPSATGPEEIVVNGMSAAERNSAWSNAAIVVETRPEDIATIAGQVGEAARNFGLANDPIAGLRFRSWLERETYAHGGAALLGLASSSDDAARSLGLANNSGSAHSGLASVPGSNLNSAPAQRLVDFLAGRESCSLPRSSYTPGVVASRLDLWLPPFIGARLQAAFQLFDKNMKGFISPDALLIASETRTSTPVRILRDKQSLECKGLLNLYPAGEGSGWSGGIVSSAMDGENCAQKILEKFL